ncbi:hypothetical protein ACWX0K_24905 (plasmid) [Nitrobacteraceae bacterium UC4446_H13]
MCRLVSGEWPWPLSRIRQRQSALQVAPDQVQFNLDCGLKTRKWKEVKPALAKLVKAARQAQASE